MTELTINGSPYYDDYDPTKKYIQLLAVPGRGEQAREFTQIQTLLLDLLKRFSNTVLKEGSIVSGMSFTLNGNDVTVHPGKVYLDGIVHDFDGGTLTITKVGQENIGITLGKSIITESDDDSLRDPAQGYSNYGQPGAHRIKAVPSLVLNDPSNPTLYVFVDGVLQSDPIRPELDMVSDLLARRTYDESGNYKVRGLTLWSEAKDDTTLNLNVEAGKAYVLGYEVIKPASSRITIDKSLDTRLVQNEPKVFHTGTNTYNLNNNPVKDISKVVATVQITKTITRGSVSGGIDYLPNSPVVSIQSVVQGATTYVSGTDYQLTTDGVDWSLSGAEPAIGSSYDVTYRYNKIMVSGTDYTLGYSGVGDSQQYYVDFTPAGDGPVDGSQFTIDYNFYLARKDLVTMDSKGAITVVKGQSAISRLVTAPSNNNPDILYLGTVYLPPNSDNAVVNSYSVTRVSMGDLQRVINRVSDLEYNQALDALDNEAMSGESPSQLKGIFSDGFGNFSKSDVYNASFNITLDLEKGEITSPTSGVSTTQPNVNTSTTTTKQWNRIATGSYTEAVGVEQPYATKAMLVNPYMVFNTSGVLTLDPYVDNWIDTQTIDIEKQTQKVFNVHRWWYHGGTFYNDTEKYLFNNLTLDDGQSWNGWDDKTGTIITNQAQTILDSSIMYMRQRSVTLKAVNLTPSTDNLELHFDGQVVSLTPVNGTVAGTNPGTIKSDAQGTAQATFTVPSGVRCGTKEVTLQNGTNTATTSYTAEGRQRTVQNNVLIERVTVHATDPVAQTFQFDSDRTISSVGLYFAAKDASANVTVQIRNAVNGYPGTTIYAETVLSPSEVTTSSDGTSETKVALSDPVIIKGGAQYSIVVMSSSSNYSIFVGELSGQDLATNAFVTKQPYVAGTLFSSSNALTWTAHQTEDLKFRVYVADFNNASNTLEFEPVTGLSTDRIALFSDYLTPVGTTCEWEAKIDSGSYTPIGVYDDMDLTAVAGQVQLKAVLTSSKYMSPMVALDSLNLVAFTTGTSGSYIGKNVQLTQSYTTVKQVIQANIPSGCAVTPKLSTDDGATWVTGSVDTTTPIDTDFTEYTYLYTIPSSGTATQFRARVDISSSSPTVKPRARKFRNIMK